jgi:hypothetical protein
LWFIVDHCSSCCAGSLACQDTRHAYSGHHGAGRPDAHSNRASEPSTSSSRGGAGALVGCFSGGGARRNLHQAHCPIPVCAKSSTLNQSCLYFRPPLSCTQFGIQRELYSCSFTPTIPPELSHTTPKDTNALHQSLKKPVHTRCRTYPHTSPCYGNWIRYQVPTVPGGYCGEMEAELVHPDPIV